MHKNIQDLLIVYPSLIEELNFIDELINNFNSYRVIKCNNNYNDYYNIYNFEDYLDKYYCLEEIFDSDMYIKHYINCSNYLMDIYPNYKKRLMNVNSILNDYLNTKILTKK